MSLTKVSYSMINGAPLNALDYGADFTGSDDSYAAIQAALDAADGSVYLPSGTYKLSVGLVIPANVTLFGDGINSTILSTSSDVTAVELSQFSTLKDLSVTTQYVGHTKNGVNVGSLTNNGRKSLIDNVWVYDVGNDGIQVIYGNVGTISNCACTSNGRDGINFTIDTADTNGWSLTGVLDLKENIRDGLHFAAGSSVSDANAPRTNSCDYIVSQSNGRYGVYVGTRNNYIVSYTENNTTKGFYLDTYAYGNDLVVLECNDAFTNNGSGNLISYHSSNANYLRQFKGQVLFGGGSTQGWGITNDDGTAGSLAYSKSAASTYQFQQIGSNTNATTYFNNGQATYKHYVKADGFNTTTTSVSVPTGAATTVASFGTASADDFFGMIYVRDAAGTLIGSSAIVTNFTNGGSQSLYLSAVQNSAALGSALTVSGGNVQFTHTVGTTRTVTVSLVCFGRSKSF